MRLFNLGLLEVIFIFILALILLGPVQMIKLARDAGKLVTRITHSPIWSAFLETSRELRDLKTKIVKEAALTDELNILENESEKLSSAVNEFISHSNISVETNEHHHQISDANESVKSGSTDNNL